MIEFNNLSFLNTLVIISIAVQNAGSLNLPCREPSLMWHNHYRRIHQVANVTWSHELWKKAKKWAEYLASTNQFIHEKKDPGNLFLSPGKPTQPCAEAVKLFYEEEKNYNYKEPQYYGNAAHFTQLVWKNTKQIGAVSKVRRDGKTVVVVKYSPPGNVAGHYAKNVFPPRKVIVTTPTPYVTTAGNATTRNFTATAEPNIFARAAVSNVKAWRGAHFTIQWLLVACLIF